MRISSSADIPGDIRARMTDSTYHDLLGPFVISIGYETSIYLTRDEAYAVLSALEAAIHDYEQATCTHPDKDLRSGDTPYCSLCGHEFEYASDENVL